MTRMIHPLPPVFDEECRILVLGSFPSVKSREEGFFYGHPQNRFWRMMAAIFDEELPTDIPSKRALLLKHRIALWDVVAACQIEGSSDASIRNALPVDLSPILNAAPIEHILCNGVLAGKLYKRCLQHVTQMEAIVLPSTSPANAGWSLPRLTARWGEALLR